MHHFGDRGVPALVDRGRRAAWCQHRVPDLRVHAPSRHQLGHAGHGFKARDVIHPLRAADRQRAEAPLAHMRHQRRHDIEHHINIAGQQILDRWPATAIGHMGDIGISQALHQLNVKMAINSAKLRQGRWLFTTSRIVPVATRVIGARSVSGLIGMRVP